MSNSASNNGYLEKKIKYVFVILYHTLLIDR